MKKTLLSMVIGSTLVISGCAGVSPGQDAMTTASTEEHHHAMSDAGDHGHHDSAIVNHHDMHQQQVHHGGAFGMGNTLAGEPGKESDVIRTITVTARDTMRFIHKPINVKNGETIKFVVTNKGVEIHEFVIATKDEHRIHGQIMANNPNMHHGPGGNAITIESGESGVLIWKFAQAPQIEAACNIKGHYEDGMFSPINVTD